MVTNLLFAAMIVVTAVGAAMIALGLLSILDRRQAKAAPLSEAPAVAEPAIFLFDDRELVDATPAGHALLAAAPMRSDDWARLSAFLVTHFDNFEESIGALAQVGELTLSGKGSAPLVLKAEHFGRLARLTLTSPADEGQGLLVDALSHRAMEDEIDFLRRATDSAPMLIWREDTNGAITWANRAYIMKSGTLDADETAVWPMPRLFDLGPDARGGNARRLKPTDGQANEWFECQSFADKDGSVNYAVSAMAAVNAETSLREFVQNLTKTFAHLPIGLAIFDRERRLRLFNPALLDLTRLSAEFLTARPTLFAFLDRLREARMLPEPKDYRVWRQKMAELEEAAANGHVEETWALPSGQTYRVTGRPHPDGAVAFLVEDISSEMTLTRRFRAEMEMSQSVIDAMDEAIAVFSSAGNLILSNSTYATLWGTDPGTSLTEIGIREAMKTWQSLGRPDPIWANARDFVKEAGSRQPWSALSELRSGQGLACRFVPLPGGATLTAFRALSIPAERRGRPETGTAATAA